MKITFVVNQYARISGGNRALFEYANRLKTAGHQVRWIVLAKSYKAYRLDKKFISLLKGVVTLPPETIDWMENSIPLEVLPYNHSKHIPSADFLVATAWQTAEFTAALPAETGKKFYFIQHYESLWVKEENREMAERTYQAPLKKIVISNWLKELLFKDHQQESTVLVTPVNKDEFYCHDKKWNVQKRICMLHHDYDWKGYKDGIEALKKTRENCPNITLVVFGEKMEDPTPLFREAGFEFEYHYRPTRSRLRDIYTSCDIYLCPSWYEGLGMPAMEAMACGCALVTTDTGGSRDYALHEETALVSPPQNTGKLTENLSRLVHNESYLIQLSKNGRRKILDYDWDDNCRRLIQLLEDSGK